MDYAGIAAVTAEDPPQSPTGRGSDLDFVWLEITEHCNLRCRHCYTTSSPARPHNNIEWRAVLDQARATGCRKVQFIGGEPLSHPEIIGYVEHAAALGFELIEIYSNLTGLTAAMCDIFARRGVHLAASFYSTSPPAHDALTLTPGSFEETIAAIALAVRRGLPLRIGVIMQEGDEEPFATKAAFLERLGVSADRIQADHVRPVGRGAKLTGAAPGNAALCGACGDRKLAVSHDGSVFPCVFARHERLGDVSGDRLGDLIHSPALQRFRNGIRREPRMCVPEPCTPDDTGGPYPCTPTDCTPTCTPNDPKCGPDFG